MKTKEELQTAIAQLRGELAAIEQGEWKHEHAPLVGTCWKYRNNYSCPEKPSDYWWCYRKVTGLREREHLLTTFEFQTDRDGNHRIETNLCAHWSGGWQPCRENEYRAAWKRLMKKLGQVSL